MGIYIYWLESFEWFSENIEPSSQLHLFGTMKGCIDFYFQLFSFDIGTNWSQFFPITSTGIFIIAALAFAIFADILAQDCQDKDDGVLIKNPDDCSKYVECRGKQSKERKCITDTLFDPEKNSCQPPNKVTSCEKVNAYNISSQRGGYSIIFIRLFLCRFCLDTNHHKWSMPWDWWLCTQRLSQWQSKEVRILCSLQRQTVQRLQTGCDERWHSSSWPKVNQLTRL